MNPDLLKLLNDYCSQNVEIFGHTRIYQDLRIYGEEASEFLTEYQKIFGVKLDDFIFEKYFPYEGHENLFFIRWIRRLFRISEPLFDELTVSKLNQGIIDGTLM